MAAKKLLTLLVLIAYNFAYAQDPTKRNYFTAYINESDKNIEVQVLKDKTNEKAVDERIYYWYANNNSIIESKGGYSGKLLHGNYISYYLNKNLREKGSFKKGLKHGTWKTWYANGILMEKSTWKNGEKNGEYILYNEQGLIMVKTTFKNNLLHGKMINYNLGSVASEKTYKNGKEFTKKTSLFKKKNSDNSTQIHTNRKVRKILNKSSDKQNQKSNWFNELFKKKNKKEDIK